MVGEPPSLRRRLAQALLLAGLLLTASILKANDPSAPPKPQTSQDGDESVLFETQPPVETAALYTQTLREAPANVSVTTRRQIRTYGYRTLAEALSRHYDLQFGIRNLTDRRYADPLSAEHLTPTRPRAGRSVFVRLTGRGGD